MARIEPHLDLQGGHQAKLTALEGPASRSRMESKPLGPDELWSLAAV